VWFRLVLAPVVWGQQLGQLAAAGGVAIGRVNRNQLKTGTELIGLTLNQVLANPAALNFGSLDELLLVELAESVDGQDAVGLLNRFDPQPGQLVAAIRLGFGSGAGQWVGNVHEYGHYFPLDELRLVGPGMHRLAVNRGPDESSLPAERWSRSRGALGEQVWQKVRASRVAVIGASRNGSVTAFTLAMLGVRSLVLIDPDREEAHGLDAILGAVPGGVGHPKVLNRREALLRIRPGDLEIRPLAIPFPHPQAEPALRDVDLICTCVDRDAARLAAAQWANRWCKVHLDIGTAVFRNDAGDRVLGADVRLLLPGQACVVCLGGLRNLDQARYEVAAPPGALRRGPRPQWHEQRAGSLVTINSIACNLGVQMYLDLLAGRITESRWCRVEITSDGRMTVDYPSSPAATCAICKRGTDG
jgi:hypothetical protein